MSDNKHTFKAEVNKVLDLMIHSLYSNKEIFLRELISNASDAIDKARYESLTDASIAEGGDEWKVELIADKEAGTLTIRDNGIGMTRDEAVEALGTIAHSGTKEFIKLLESREVENNPELIGQFGVGFYSSFMVADQVTVITRKAGADANHAVVWKSDADGTYTLEDGEKDGKGTDVILKLKEDETSYLEEWELRKIVKQYSDFIEYPIVMEVTRTTPDPEDEEKSVTETKEETLNSQKAIWLKSKDEISDEEYNEFYKHLSHDFTDPAKVIHYRAEGTTEFSALLYLPEKRPYDIFYQDYKIGPALYVRRVQIMDHCEAMLPTYLRFVKGVVESSDLPLNVSREMLQENKVVNVIKKNLIKKVLDTLGQMKKNDLEAYEKFYAEFGRILKEGIHHDFERKETIADLLLFESTTTEPGKTTTLADYIERMGEDQKEIYYITGSDRASAEASPYLEVFKEKGLEVLIMTDDFDDIIISGLGSYQEKPFQSAIKGDLDLGETDKEEQKKTFGDLLELMKEELKDVVSDVRISGRLKDSAVCLVAGEHDLDPKMAKMFEAMGQDVPQGQRVLEVNPGHDLIGRMKEAFAENSGSEQLKEYVGLLYDQALLLEGDKPRDPVAFSRALSKLMAQGVSM
ncbi:molecular chaperone HtpG [Desulfuromonas acetoxidans]|uniref:molecular chaperone HtpG n=1 Tax=Desulfuromonas acetoxidans TaxID=891 RepID=UPI001592C323|nr:molecular chaperone HtpG [Desulfuromonas acetoxidans]MBF0645250.1 molecular chaperone HtpG [Desulfuromonas acetoxidans]NVD25556.1 molecular chaperone HtpG [Desulfuromonas acetoxidans]NVE17634.1 molecular chaperone HtpG [Desulfuromonas acetoxidans]